MSKKSKIRTVLFSIIAFIVGIVTGVSSYALAFSPESDILYSVVSGDLSVHFLEVGNKYAGDSIYIKANDKDILIDAGSRESSANTIINYVNNYCTDKKLEYLIATHAHQDHIAAMPGIFEYYNVENIIDFGTATKYEKGAEATGVYTKYITAREKEIEEENANYIAVSDFNEEFQTTIDLGNGITLEILENYYYYNTTSNENNYSVCLLIKQGSTKVLLTGDLEGEGEQKLVELNGDILGDCTLFKAAHHGSYTGSTNVLLDVAKPKNVVFTCVAGSTEYTKNLDNTFPAQATIDRIAKYTKNCYVTSVCTSNVRTNPSDYSQYTSMNGDIIFTSNKEGYKFVCNNNSTLLKDTSWFKEYRTCPSYWA